MILVENLIQGWSQGSAFFRDFSLRQTLSLIRSTVTVRKLSDHKQGPESLLCPRPCKSLAVQSNVQYIGLSHHCFNKRTLIQDIRLALRLPWHLPSQDYALQTTLHFWDPGETDWPPPTTFFNITAPPWIPSSTSIAGPI